MSAKPLGETTLKNFFISKIIHFYSLAQFSAMDGGGRRAAASLGTVLASLVAGTLLGFFLSRRVELQGQQQQQARGKGGRQKDGKTSKGRGRGKSSTGREMALQRFMLKASPHCHLLGDKGLKELKVMPREAFLQCGSLPRNDLCLDRLVSLSTAGNLTPNFRMVYFCHQWQQGKTPDDSNSSKYKAAVRFLVEHPEYDYVFLDFSCMNQQVTKKGGPSILRTAQLRALPLVLLRSDALVVLPKMRGSQKFRSTDLIGLARRAWCQMEIVLAYVGRSEIFVNFENIVEKQASFVRLDGSCPSLVFAMLEGQPNMTEKLAEGMDEDDLMPEPIDLLKAAAKDAEDLGDECNALLNGDLRQEIGSSAPLITSDVLGSTTFIEDGPLVQRLLLFTVSRLKNKRSDYAGLAVPRPVVCKPIGVVRSPYKERFGTPRQAPVRQGTLGASEQLGEIVLADNDRFREALENLEDFDYVWVLSYFHLNRGWSSRVSPPRLGRAEKKGTFATRSPHRPNALGLSALKISSVDAAAGIIKVIGLDLLDNTPVLDIKPYVPYCDAFPDAKAGWTDGLGAENAQDHRTQEDTLEEFSVGSILIRQPSESQPQPHGEHQEVA
jgi:tRNA-Thr(GGU) m(6)t(6)A37 methyltransferase TsaA